MPSSAKSKRFKVPIAASAALIIICILEWTFSNTPQVWKLLDFYTNRDTDQMLFEAGVNKYQNLEKTHKKRILFIGGSAARESIDCDQILSHLPDDEFECSNLGSVVIGPIEVYAHMEKFLDSDADIIIWLYNFSDFHQRYQIRGMALYGNLRMLTYLFKYGLWDHFQAVLPYITKVMLGGVSPTYRNRMDLQLILPVLYGDLIQGSLRKERRFSFIDVERMKNRKERRLGKALPWKVRRELYKMDNIDITRKAPRFDLGDQVFRDAFETFLGKAKEMSINLQFIHAPIRKDRYRLDDETFKYLDNTIDVYGFDHVTVDELPKFRKRDYLDRNHLNKHGRKTFSKFLGEFIQQHFSKRQAPQM